MYCICIQFIVRFDESLGFDKARYGEFLDEPLRIGTASAPFELLVVDVTDQGKRRPSLVARLYVSSCDARMTESRWPSTAHAVRFSSA